MLSYGKYIISIAYLMDSPPHNTGISASLTPAVRALWTSAHSSCPCRALTHSAMLPSVVLVLTTHLQRVLYTAPPQNFCILHQVNPKEMKQEISFDLLLNTGLKKPLVLQFLSYILCCTTATKITNPCSNCRIWDTWWWKGRIPRRAPQCLTVEIQKQGP